MNVSHPVSRRRQGFTLIELVVVIAILAVIAGLAVVVIDWIRPAADRATASSNMTAIASNVQLYRTTFGGYPDRFDSLLDGTGTMFTKLHPELGTERLTTYTLTANDLESLNDVGILNVMDHDTTAPHPGNSGTLLRTLQSGDNVAILNSADPAGQEVIGALYPSALGSGGTFVGLPANIHLVALGVGPANTAVGKTILSPPVYTAFGGGANTPSNTYSRFLCVFAVDNTGASTAQLRGVIDSKGDYLTEELTEYYQNLPK